MIEFIKPSDFKRFEAFVSKPNENGCELWTGSTTKGYGKFGLRKHGITKLIYAHRFAFIRDRGLILDDLTIDHLCREKLCVNSKHMEVVTRGENVLRGMNPPAINARKKECNNGHQFDEQNTWIEGNGWRHCRICNKLNQRKQRALKKRAWSVPARDAIFLLK